MEQNAPIAFIGLGVMGLPMAGHLLDAGYRLSVFTRTKSKAQPLLERSGANVRWTDSPKEAAEGADIAISIVGYPDDVRETHLDANGTLAAANPPRIIIDMTTSTPALAVEIADTARTRNIASIDAPVSGGDIGARSATLSIMVGGEAEAVGQVRPIFEKLGKTIVHHGPPGAGQHAKMVNQILIASSMMGVCEGLLYASKAGLDPMKVIESVGSGAAGSWSINNLGPRMIQRDFNPGFYVEHFVKDLGIALEESSRMKLAMPGLALAKQLYEALRDQGHAKSGTQALLLALEKLSGM